jgi:hypothetical protein
VTDDLPAFIRAQLNAEAKLIRRLNCDDLWTAVAGACGPEIHVQPASPYSSGKPSVWERTEVPYSVWDCDDFSDYEGCASMRDSWMAEAEFIAAHNPASALADIKVKRRIPDEHPHVPGVQQEHGDEYDFGCLTCHADTHCGETVARGWCMTVRLMAYPHRLLPEFKEDWLP